MKKQDFEILKADLYVRGYLKYNQHWHNEDYVIGKGFHKEDNQWEKNCSAYQVLFSVYDFDNRYLDLHPAYKNRVNMEVHIDVSRTADERIEMIIPWRDNTTIEEVEEAAEKFYAYVLSVFPNPW